MSGKRPLYPRLLRLRHVSPNAWQRALLGEGALAVAAVLVLADLATAWTLLALPLAVAVVVKVHDVLAGLLRGPQQAQGDGVRLAGEAPGPGAAAGRDGGPDDALPQGGLSDDGLSDDALPHDGLPHDALPHDGQPHEADGHDSERDDAEPDETGRQHAGGRARGVAAAVRRAGSGRRRSRTG